MTKHYWVNVGRAISALALNGMADAEGPDDISYGVVPIEIAESMVEALFTRRARDAG